MSTWDGVYAAYMTGSEGQGFGLFVFIGGRIVGADPLGVKFDGTFEENEANDISGTIDVTVPANGTVIQGISTGNSGMTYSTPLSLTKAAMESSFFPIATPLGVVNVKLEKIRSLN